jgi:hypothetical protein
MWEKMNDHPSGVTRWVRVNTIQLKTMIPRLPMDNFSSIIGYAKDDCYNFLRILKQIYMVQMKTMHAKTI